MTYNPVSVSNSDLAIDALNKMIAGHFRHLPVCDNEGDLDHSRSLLSQDVDDSRSATLLSEFGVLDITRCINQSLDKIEMAYLAKYRNALNEGKTSLLSGSALTRYVKSEERGALPILDGLLESDALAAYLLPGHATVLDACVCMEESRETAVLIFSHIDASLEVDAYDPSCCTLVGTLN
jgi:CBS domain-containing protein